MDCRQCDELLPSYAAGELGYQKASEVRMHLDRCECCRGNLDVVASVISAVADEPEMVPTAAESAALAAALSRVKLPEPVARRTRERRSNELFGFVLASIAAFVAVALLLTKRMVNIADVLSASPYSILMAIVPVLIVVFVTSFIPIVVTAYRRPLNGMTFRR